MSRSSPWASLLPPLGVVLGVVLAGMAVLLWLNRGQSSSVGAEDTGRLIAAVQASRAEARDALSGNVPSFTLLTERAAEIERLRRSLSGASDVLAGVREFAAGNPQWPTVVAALDEMESAQGALTEFHGARTSLVDTLTELRRGVGQSTGRPDSAEGQANRGLWERIDLRVQRMQQEARSLATPADVEDATARLDADMQSLTRDIGAIGARPAAGAEAGAGAAALLDAARNEIDQMTTALPRIAAAVVAAGALDNAGTRLMQGFESLQLAGPVEGTAVLAEQLPLVLAGTSVVVLLLIALAYYKARDFRRAAAVQTEQNEQNQQAILKLLDELSSLADGDLTVQATVTEDITGAIADSINYAIEALRELVATVNESAILVDGAARQSKSVVNQLVQSSDNQAKQVRAATEAIAKMVASAAQVSGNAERCSDVARHSVAVAHKGGEAVRRTIDGMNTIRETIQDTSKRIKRLGESSQEIGNIVELIDEIAEQTNILALNASIEASRAGEASRGFAVVADEVQKLAERSSNATRKIEVLVSTIQSDTNEAVVSMERSTTDVVGGALLAENAGAALDEIEQVSHQIASLVHNISTSAGEQSSISEALKKNMLVLREISTNTKDATAATSSAIGKLSELAAQQRRAVSGFTLPEDMTGSGIFAGQGLSLGIKPRARKAETSEAAAPAAVERRQSV